MAELTKSERIIASRARGALHRLVGMEMGDELADQLVDHYAARHRVINVPPVDDSQRGTL